MICTFVGDCLIKWITMERKIGEVFELDGVKLRVEEAVDAGTPCDFCFLSNKWDWLCGIYDTKEGSCCKEDRLDNTDVIFTEVKE